MSTQHTPGPWTRTPEERFKHDSSAGIKGPNGNYLAAALDFNRTDRDEEVEANAEFIVRACNAHDELLAALEDIIETPVGHTTADCAKDLAACIRIARAAIAKAKGHTP